MQTVESRSQERCGNLRWKGMFIDIDGGAPTPESQSSEHVCWCVLTQGPLGPDGQVADEDICNPFRSCYRVI